MALIDNLIAAGWLKTPRIIEAFKKIKREDFLPPESRDMAEFNGALPIGLNQTISQPLTVAFMLELLEPKEGENILDVGSGSGWTAALLSEITGNNGKVTAIEIIPELKIFGEKNAAKYGFVQNGIAEFVCGDGSEGYEKNAPYDKILASAAAKKLPEAWKKQIKIGRKIVTPIYNSIWLFVKKSETEFEEKEYPGFIFVPLVKN
ncbi:MAG: protein-L-isoaspartate O-methyltransferase [Parcubacteria group bacterium]